MAVHGKLANANIKNDGGTISSKSWGKYERNLLKVVSLIFLFVPIVTSELVRLNTENSHLQQEKQSHVETIEKLSEKAAALVCMCTCVKSCKSCKVTPT